MTKWERIDNVIAGAKVDRPPASFWRHYHHEETTPERLAAVTTAFSRKYDWDFIKVCPRDSYHAEVWGTRFSVPLDEHTPPELIERRVQKSRDWAELTAVPADEGVLGDHLRALRMIHDEVEELVPFIMTIFSPLSIAAQLAGGDDPMLTFLRDAPDMVHSALGAITQTFSDFAVACLEAGASGIFFDVRNWPTRNLLCEAEFDEFGKQYDLALLDAVKDRARFNVLHVGGESAMLLELLEYPVHVYNWDTIHETNPTLADILDMTGRAVMGGVELRRLASDSPDEAINQLRQAWE